MKCEWPDREINELLSLSSWRAWIEIGLIAVMFSRIESLSSWRAWIEILIFCELSVSLSMVALLMESVD